MLTVGIFIPCRELSYIYQRYIHGKNIGITNTELRAKTYLIFGDFLNSQLKKLHSGEEIEKCKERCKIGKLNMDNLNMIKNNTVMKFAYI